MGIEDKTDHVLTLQEKAAVEQVSGLSHRLAPSILKVSTVDQTVLWTGTENVWFWVQSQCYEFKQIIAHNNGEIQWTTSPKQWRHVPGTSN